MSENYCVLFIYLLEVVDTPILIFESRRQVHIDDESEARP